MTVKDLRTRFQELETQGKGGWIVRDSDGAIVTWLEVLSGSVFLDGDCDTSMSGRQGHQPVGG